MLNMTKYLHSLFHKILAHFLLIVDNWLHKKDLSVHGRVELSSCTVINYQVVHSYTYKCTLISFHSIYFYLLAINKNP